MRGSLGITVRGTHFRAPKRGIAVREAPQKAYP
jgi:hypothetical protein